MCRPLVLRAGNPGPGRARSLSESTEEESVVNRNANPCLPGSGPDHVALGSVETCFTKNKLLPAVMSSMDKLDFSLSAKGLLLNFLVEVPVFWAKDRILAIWVSLSPSIKQYSRRTF